MAAFDFSPAQAAASTAKGQQASVPIQSLLMQIDADAVCLVRTQFQQIRNQGCKQQASLQGLPSFCVRRPSLSSQARLDSDHAA